MPQPPWTLSSDSSSSYAYDRAAPIRQYSYDRNPYQHSSGYSSPAYPYEDSSETSSQAELTRERNHALITSLQYQVHGPREFMLGVQTLLASDLITRALAGKDWGIAERKLKYSIEEDRRGNRRIQSIQGKILRRPQQRRAWDVRIVYNTWRPVKSMGSLTSPSLHQLLAHWGVAFRLSDEPNAPYQVYSMDFESEFRWDLVVQSTWWTSEGGWVQEVYDQEIEVVQRKHGYSWATMYFSEAELAITAHKVLEYYLQYHYDSDTMKALERGPRKMQKHFEKYNWKWNAGTGRLYGLLSRNCQDYATYLFDTLLEQGWCDKRRLHYDWDPEYWLANSDRMGWLQVPPSRKWKRINKILQEAFDQGVSIAAVYLMLKGLRDMFVDDD